MVITCTTHFYDKSSSGVGVGVLLAADSQLTSASGYRASLWNP
jgi:hypothetical protein